MRRNENGKNREKIHCVICSGCVMYANFDIRFTTCISSSNSRVSLMLESRRHTMSNVLYGELGGGELCRECFESKIKTARKFWESEEE